MDRTFNRDLFITSIAVTLSTILWIVSWTVGVFYLKLDHSQGDVTIAYVLGCLLVIAACCLLMALGFNIYDVLSD
jgi:uncharacterized membrane protein